MADVDQSERCPSERSFEGEPWPVRCDLLIFHSLAHRARGERFLWTDAPTEPEVTA